MIGGHPMADGEISWGTTLWDTLADDPEWSAYVRNLSPRTPLRTAVRHYVQMLSSRLAPTPSEVRSAERILAAMERSGVTNIDEYLDTRRARGARASAAESTPEPLPIEVLTADVARSMFIEATEERVTDIVNHEDTLTARSAIGSVPARQGAVEELPLDEVLVVVPPPRRTNPKHRLHRLTRPVRIVVGPYEVIGEAHIPPGTQPAGFLLRTGQRFVPLTTATVRLTESPESGRRVPVAIVNLARADLLREVASVDA
jgi:hypothetical protein